MEHSGNIPIFNIPGTLFGNIPRNFLGNIFQIFREYIMGMFHEYSTNIPRTYICLGIRGNFHWQEWLNTSKLVNS